MILPLIVRGSNRPDLLRDETLPDLFEATAARVPNKTALICGASGRTLTYAELDDVLADLPASWTWGIGETNAAEDPTDPARKARYLTDLADYTHAHGGRFFIPFGIRQRNGIP